MRIPGKPKISAGLLLYRIRSGQPEVLLAHPGGPFWAKKDEGHWTIPKGQPDPDEDLIHAAQREFFEEVGFAPLGPFTSLGTILQKGGKTVHAWACEGDLPCEFQHRCNTFEVEWPLGSGKLASFPEIDRVEFFALSEARKRLKESQRPLLDRLEELLQLRPR